MAKQITDTERMDILGTQLDEMHIHPSASSWLKLDNRLYEHKVSNPPKQHNKLMFGMIAASLAVVLTASFLLLPYIDNHSLEGTAGFEMVETSFASTNTTDIYNIKQLSDLNSAYHHKGMIQ